MTSIANPPGYDPRRLPRSILRSGPMLNWYWKSTPTGMGDACEECEPTPSSCPSTPDPATGAADEGCTGGSGSSGGRSGGTGPQMAARGMAMQRVIDRVAPSLPLVRSPEGCTGCGVCGGYVNLDGRLALRIGEPDTDDPFAVCPELMIYISLTPSLPTVLQGGFSPSVVRDGSDATLTDPAGTRTVYTNQPADGGYYDSPEGVQTRLRRVNDDEFDEECFNGLTRHYSDVGTLMYWTANAGTWTVTEVEENEYIWKEIEDPAGKVTTLLYDLGSRPTKVVDSAGREMDFSYDGNNRLAEVTSPEQCVTEFTYDGSDRVRTWTTPSGLVTTFSYDSSNRVETIETPEGTRTFSYNANDDMWITDPRGGVTTYLRETSGELKTYVNALGERTSYSWDAKWPRTIEDPRGHVYTFNYQTLTGSDVRQLQSIELPEGGCYTYQLDGSNDLEAMIDERGNRVSMTYSSDRLESIEDPLGRRTTYSYSAAFHQPEEIQDASGQRWSAVYDAATGRKTAGVNPLDQRTSYTYSDAGFVRTIENARGEVTTLTRDDVNRLTVAENALGYRTSSTYETGTGQLESVEDARGYVTTYHYDAATGRLSGGGGCAGAADELLLRCAGQPDGSP